MPSCISSARIFTSPLTLAVWSLDFSGGFAYTRSTPAVVVTQPSPTVSITSPTNNATFAAPANVTFKANASVGTGTVTNVAFLQWRNAN